MKVVKMRIRLNNKFYTRDAIEDAIVIFNDVCDCSIVNDFFEIELIPKSKEHESIKEEFCNFVLGITKDKKVF